MNTWLLYAAEGGGVQHTVLLSRRIAGGGGVVVVAVEKGKGASGMQSTSAKGSCGRGVDGRQAEAARKRERAKLRRLVYARCVPLFRGFIAAVGINEGPCFHGGRVAVQISFYYLPRGIYSTTTDRQGVVVVSSMVGGE